MLKKAKWEDLKIGLLVKEFPSQEYWYTIRDIRDDKVYFSTDNIPNMRIYITKKQLGKEFYELWFNDNQQTLF